MLDTARERVMLTRRLVAALCIGSLALQIGCYSYLPVQSQAPNPLERVSVTVNDRGRVLLGDRVGAGTNRIEGRIVRTDSAVVVLSVSRVIDINGNDSHWLGEEVSIPRDGILGFQARPISKPRTFVLVAAIVGGIIAIALSLSLAVGGSIPDGTTGDGQTGPS